MAGVVFFDLVGTLIVPSGGSWALRPEAAAWLQAGGRLGVLCNAGPFASGRDVQRVLEQVGAVARVEPELVVMASNLPHPLPDRRAFAVAAALAEVPIERCVYVSADASMLVAAGLAGMRPVAVGPAAPAAAAPPAAATAPAASAAPPDTPLTLESARPAPTPVQPTPTFVLRGRVVTMAKAGEVLDDAQVVVAGGQIAEVVPKGQALPPAYAGAAVIDTGGTIYPGLIDLHNHFAYNVRELWPLPKRYDNRGQWGTPRYSSEVSQPVKTLAKGGRTARALVRYVEAKALIGGTSTGQGIKTQVRGGTQMFRGAMRNVEESDDPRLADASTLVPDLWVKDPDRVEKFRKALDRWPAYFYHLAEGIDDASRQHFLDLRVNDLVKRSLVGVHSLGLHEEDLAFLASQRAKVVWSPFSNLLLYGRTLDLAALRRSGVTFSIGCDWAPTGSKNLLQELKVARHEVARQQADYTSEELVRAVTVSAAAVTGWQDLLGVLRKGALADLLVIEGTGGDAFDHLIDATEPAVRLVVIDGRARYGDRDLMDRLHVEPEHPLEPWSLDGREKALHLYSPTSQLNDLSFATAVERLEAGMADLPKLAEESKDQQDQLLSMGMEEPSFAVELDNEYEPGPGEGADAEGELLAAIPMIKTIALDAPQVGSPGYWDLVDAQPNIGDDLKQALRQAYGG
jgi:5-methylthioadenosine/S-adenosylhomocysteine deaminase